MSSASRSLAVLGGQGLTRDLVSHVLVTAGFSQTKAEDAEVAVLVDPDSGEVQSARGANARVVVITSNDIESERVTSFVLQGADAVLHTAATASEIEDAVHTVADGGSVLPPCHLRAVLDRVRAEPPKAPDRLTIREIEILQCIDRGLSVKQTGRELGISAKTVENLQSRLFRKLGVRNRAQAVSQAHQTGVLRDTPT